LPLNEALAIRKDLHLNLNPSFFHLIKSPYWWQLYFFWISCVLLSFGLFNLGFIASGYIVAFIGSFSYFVVCFGSLFIAPIRRLLVRDGAYWNKHHKVGLFFYSLVSGILSLSFIMNVLSIGAPV